MVFKEHVRAKFHRVKCRVIVRTEKKITRKQYTDRRYRTDNNNKLEPGSLKNLKRNEVKAVPL